MQPCLPGAKVFKGYRGSRLSPEVAGNDIGEVAPLQRKIIDFNDQIARKQPSRRRGSPAHDLQDHQFPLDRGHNLQTDAAEDLLKSQGMAAPENKKDDQEPSEPPAAARPCRTSPNSTAADYN